MFSASRQGGFIYILSKGEKPNVKIALIQDVTTPVPKYPTYNPSIPYNTQPEMLVDIKAKCGDEIIDLQKLPANADTFSYSNNVFVFERKEAVIAEIESMFQTSKQAIESTSYHQSVVECCDSILKELNPQFAKEKQREEKIESLEKQVFELKGNMSELKGGVDDIKSLILEMSSKPRTTTSKN